MRSGGRMMGLVAGCLMLAVSAGCASLDDHRRLEAANRNLRAEKEALAQDLFDARSNLTGFQSRSRSLERELSTNTELAANLRRENELLDGMAKAAQATMEEMAGKQGLGDITIRGPKLPVPLHEALKRFAADHPTAVAYDAVRGNVKWKSDLLFALGSDIVKQSSLESLQTFTQVIMSPPAAGFEVVVVGHTDNTPIVRAATKAKHPTNWHLSSHRAISVASVLRKYGYPAERIAVKGYGEFRPLADNSTAAGKSKNRRVEIYLVPKGTAIASRREASPSKALATVRP